MFGFLNVNKPPGPTSHDLVARVRRMLPHKTKVGHAGTLDPFAGGVLVLCVGPATRLACYVQKAPKRYRAEITLGATSSTDDGEGAIRAAPSGKPPPQPLVREALRRFVGDIEQVPPAHSAVHVGGRRAYQLARAGQDVELPARKVRIHELALVEYAWPSLTVDVRCGSGTYIRALARDVGASLEVGGYCSKLVRTAVGAFTLGKSIVPDELDAMRDLLSPLVALEDLPRLQVDATGAERIAMGQRVPVKAHAVHSVGLGPRDMEIAALDEEGDLLALGTLDAEGAFRPSKVFRGA